MGVKIFVYILIICISLLTRVRTLSFNIRRIQDILCVVCVTQKGCWIELKKNKVIKQKFNFNVFVLVVYLFLLQYFFFLHQFDFFVALQNNNLT